MYKYSVIICLMLCISAQHRFTAAMHTSSPTTHPHTDVTTHSTALYTTLNSTEAPMHTTQTTTDAVTEPLTITSSASTIYRCVRCDREPCVDAEMANQPAVHCPTSHPYCYTGTVQTNSRRSVSKGCADLTFCRRLWWEYTSVSTLCREPCFSTTKVDLQCTFCCQGDDCNTEERPADNTLISFYTSASRAKPF